MSASKRFLATGRTRHQDFVHEAVLFGLDCRKIAIPLGVSTHSIHGLPGVLRDDFVRAAFRLILASEPSGDELAACRAALGEWKALPAGSGVDPSARARVNLVHALLNHNDFVTVR